MAIIIEEAMDELKKYLHIQVFGTDLDGDAIAVARNGSYPSSIASDVGEERLRKFFIKIDDQYQVKRDLREKLVFAVHDIIVDPPFTRMDLVSARNLLIYFDANLQKRLVPMFSYSLKEKGLLFLGTAETIGEFDDLFVPLDRKWKLFRVEKKSKQSTYSLPENISWREPAVPGRQDQFKAGLDTGTKLPESIMLEALPPSLLVDINYQVIFTHGDTRKYLGLPQGKPRTDILAMARSELRPHIASGLHEVLSTGEEVVRDGCRIKNNGDTQTVKITFKPVSTVEGSERPAYVVVTFYDMPRIKKSRVRKNQVDPERLKELEQELQFTKETLRGTIEELETANEELRSANEEYQSTNEELQSTNEELETSCEELQSLNEELTTLNTEYQRKIEELTAVNDDMKNLLNITGVATIFLDTDLKLQRFTPAATRIFNFIEADVGRPLSDITSRLE
ncbi:MAG: PAS domain-containing protein, partial [Dehalococcoidales bacterium]|nr:PAS domain-containing protein [Dehalococcoidales bacterium]